MAVVRKAWSRDELLVAFNLYCRIPFGRLHMGNGDVIKLAGVCTDLHGRTQTNTDEHGLTRMSTDLHGLTWTSTDIHGLLRTGDIGRSYDWA